MATKRLTPSERAWLDETLQVRLRRGSSSGTKRRQLVVEGHTPSQVSSALRRLVKAGHVVLRRNRYRYVTEADRAYAEAFRRVRESREGASRRAQSSFADLGYEVVLDYNDVVCIEPEVALRIAEALQGAATKRPPRGKTLVEVFAEEDAEGPHG